MLSSFPRFTAVTIEFALLYMLCGKGLLVALWYSNVEGFAFHCLPGSSPDIIDSTFCLMVFTWKEYVFT